MAGNARAGMNNTGYGSAVANGQLVGFPTRAAYAPLNFGGGVSAVPAASPVTIPPSIGYGMSSSGTGSNVTSNQNRGTYTGGFMGSPAMWAFIMMAAGLLWLRYIHWHK